MEGKDVDMVFLKHSYRDTVLDEHVAVQSLRLDDLNVVLEQFNTYQLTDPGVLFEKLLTGGFLLRKHLVESVIATMEDWLAQVLRYSHDEINFHLSIMKS